MSGSNPSITATVTTVDHATGTLQNIAELSKRITNETNGALAANAAEMQRGMNATHGSFAADARQLSGAYKAAMTDIKLLGTEAATHVLRAFSDAAKKVSSESVDIGESIEKQLLKIKAFTSATPADIDNILKSAAAQGASLPGGLRANVEAARAAAMSGVRPDSAGLVATHGQMFAYETGQDAAAATEDLVSHASMLGHIRDDKGKVIPASNATNAQLEKGLTETQNLLIAINKLAPGNLHDVYEGFKFGAPSNMSAKVTSGELGAEYIQFAEKGIRGSEAGVAARAGIASLAAPTGKARMAAASIGVDIDKYRGIDYSQLHVDNVLAGVASRIGREKSEGMRGGTSRAIEAYKLDGNAAKLNDPLVTLIQHSGAKTLTDHVKAANLERDVISPLVSKVDFPGFIAALNEAKAGIGAFNQIFGSKQGGKLIVLDGARMAKDAGVLEAAEHGDNYAKSISEFRESYLGRKQAATGAKEVAEEGIFTTEKPLREKMFGFQEAIAKLAADHPTLSSIGVEGAKYGVGAAATIGGYAVQLQFLKYLRAAQQAAPAIEGALPAGEGALGAAAGSTAARVASGGLLAAGASIALPVTAAAGLTYGLIKLRDPSRQLGGSNAEDYTASELPYVREAPKAERPMAPPTWLGMERHGGDQRTANFAAAVDMERGARSRPGGDGLAAAIDGLRSSMSSVSVQGDVRGEATLRQIIQIEASPLLLATVANAQATTKMGLEGRLGTTMRGSNATMASVAPGLSTFKPTMSGR